LNQDEAIYAWSPLNGSVHRIVKALDDKYITCEQAGERLLCVRETALEPSHVAAIDLKSGKVDVVADVNPEFQSIKLATILPIAWDMPRDTAGFGFAGYGDVTPSIKLRGYVLLPPNFDSKLKYPVVVCPYRMKGFHRGDVGDEQPMEVYAANGFVVVNTSFPFPWKLYATDEPNSYFKKWYADGFPMLTMLMEATLGGLDQATEGGYIDSHRVGMGGISSAAAIALFTLQVHDRLSAVSVAQVGIGPFVNYQMTRAGSALFDKMWGGKPLELASPETDEGRVFWRSVDLANQAETIEAPVLFHFADEEALAAPPLLRHMDDAGRPYDAYIFRDEYHTKWQPAHRHAIYQRNLDWFRFWLQDYVDPVAEKAEQYSRWRKLRELQCRNPRSLSKDCRSP
jgi:dipeptidyl aminopeptidase/acylaminoacyl peptidase